MEDIEIASGAVRIVLHTEEGKTFVRVGDQSEAVERCALTLTIHTGAVGTHTELRVPAMAKFDPATKGFAVQASVTFTEILQAIQNHLVE